ncbi:MAG: hypothetical protein CM1200mP39_11320 [Dehalococcoidia bacterium]|nr:MAG: hypothetical protein CM1200mP39_11320 [Dehalococcoidia bacterium]
MSRVRSEQLFSDAKLVMPGGVNSPARAWGAVGGSPFFLRKLLDQVFGTLTATSWLITYVPGVQ